MPKFDFISEGLKKILNFKKIGYIHKKENIIYNICMHIYYTYAYF